MEPSRPVLRRVLLACLVAAALGPAMPAGAGPRVLAGRQQCDALVRAALPMAQRLLQTLGEFAPYGMALSGGDEVMEVDAAPDPAAPRQAEPGDALRDKLADALKRGEVQATALVYEAAIAVPSSTARADAIAIQLAHRDGYRAVFVVPYRFENGAVVLGQPQVIEQKGRPARLPPPRKKH